jgi:hypothetical protein
MSAVEKATTAAAVPATLTLRRGGRLVCRCGEVRRFAGGFARCDASGALVDGTPDGYLLVCLVCGLIVDLGSDAKDATTVRVVGEASAYLHVEPAWPPRDDAVRGCKLAVVHTSGEISFREEGDLLVAALTHERRLAVPAAARLLASRGAVMRSVGPLHTKAWWSITEACPELWHNNTECWTWRSAEENASWCGRFVPPGTPGAVPVTVVRAHVKPRDVELVLQGLRQQDDQVYGGAR